MKKVAVIGLGLIGGSLAKALRQTNRYTVHGIARKPETLRNAKRLGAIDLSFSGDEGVCGVDVVVIATPVATVVPILRRILPKLSKNTIVTDVGSVKGAILREAQSLPFSQGIHFVGSHPLAGSHETGLSAARSDLFKGATCVVVPGDRHATAEIASLWRAVGARVLKLTAEAHDQAVAVTSHLPHLIAHALVMQLRRSGQRLLLEKLVAGSFRDMTRVAASDVTLWQQVFAANQPAVRAASRQFTIFLRQLLNNLSNAELAETLARSQRFRRSLFTAKRA